MKEYIDKSELLEKMSRNSITEKITFADGKSIIETVREFPAADVVEVVRCKNCKYIRQIVNEYTHDVTGLWCSLFDIENVEENHFCSYGERRGWP